MGIRKDSNCAFPSYFIEERRKPDQRRIAAQLASAWMKVQHKREARGAVMLDIDDTLIDCKESLAQGFDHMLQLFRDIELLYPIHIVTARPDNQHMDTLKLLRKRGFKVETDRLHMLPAHLWGEDTVHVERFKWQTFLKIAEIHGGVVARLGDKLWDVAHMDALHGNMAHIRDKDCCCFLDPRLRGTMSVKLPGF